MYLRRILFLLCLGTALPGRAQQAELEKAAFYELFWELDQDSMQAYIDDNPHVLNNG